MPLYFCPEKLSSLTNRKTSLMCSTVACLQQRCWLAVLVTPRLASAVKGFPSHADGSPWCQNTAWLMWLLKNGTGWGSVCLFACGIVEGGKAMLRLGICLANVVKPFQVHREVTNVKSGHLLVQCSEGQRCVRASLQSESGRTLLGFSQCCSTALVKWCLLQ